MSPEQASGLPLDARSDIFSFAVVLYEVLAGRRPFGAGSEAEILNAVVRGAPQPLPDHVPTPLRAVVEKALEKNPSHRYQTMRELVVDLRRLSRQIVDHPLASGKRRGWRVAVAVALLAAAIAGWWLLRGSRPAEPLRVEFTQLTNFSDSVVAPTLSPDGRTLAFIRGDNTFSGPGDVYVKLLPDGEPVALTHDRTDKMGPLVFSPDGSRIAYTIGTRSTWTVPVFGGEPTRMLANGEGLSWFENEGQRRILFSAHTGEGIHMGLFAATESRAEERSIYIPADVNGMAHRSFLSPDHKSVLVVEMDITSWLPCRLLPFDGSSSGARVGPQPALCTDAAWSPDGKWMYFSADTGGGYHIWRQRYPDGVPQQVTATATEEQGISFAADGRSFLTSVGEKLSTIWVHDARGEREITSQGYAFQPAFSADGKHLYYLQRARDNRRFVSGELWSVVLDSGKREHLLPDFVMEHYSVAADGNHVTFVSVDDAGHSSVWIATLDRSVAPRRLSSLESVRARFGTGNDVFFVGGETTKTMFLYRVKDDGSGLQKMSPNRALFLYDVSPDGKWVSVWQLEDSAVALYSTESDARTIVCTHCGTAGEENRGVTPPLVSWSRDGKYLFLHYTGSRETYALPLAAGRMVPNLPEAGFESIQSAAEGLGAKPIPDPRAFPSSDPSVYAFPRLTTHRNIYRITVPK
jgi:Tol biopolymer transport system component